jgi:hypothetical protein
VPAEARPAADPGDRVARRVAARLREGVMEEEAGRREEPPQPPRYDDAMLQRDLALMRKHGQGRRSLPADILDEIEADPETSPVMKAHLRRVCMAMPEGRARAARNGLPPGPRLARTALLEGEDPLLLENLRRSRLRALVPEDREELAAVEAMVGAEWHLIRLDRLLDLQVAGRTPSSFYGPRSAAAGGRIAWSIWAAGGSARSGAWTGRTAASCASGRPTGRGWWKARANPRTCCRRRTRTGAKPSGRHRHGPSCPRPRRRDPAAPAPPGQRGAARGPRPAPAAADRAPARTRGAARSAARPGAAGVAGDAAAHVRRGVSVGRQRPETPEVLDRASAPGHARSAHPRWRRAGAGGAGALDIYHVWCDLVPGASDLAFARNVRAWLGHLQERGAIAGFRLTRRKLGLGPEHLAEFHIMIEVVDLARLDRAFEIAAGRAEPAEGLHHAVNRMARNARFALYRDFPDPARREGEERF